MRSEPEARIGYVLKVYPRFSETFVVTEILAREAQGERITVFALRPTTDARFHAELARVQAPVHHIPRATKPVLLWSILRDASADPMLADGITRHLEDLLAVDVDDALQAVLVAETARREGITHLHAHFASVATTVARLASLISGIPYSFTAHAKDLFHESASQPDLELKFRDAAFAVTVSDYNLDFIRRTLAHRRHVHRVYNGLDLERFPFVTRPRRGQNNDVTLVAVGRLVEKKGFDLLVDAVVRLRNAGAPLRLSIAGDGEQRDELRARVAASGHADAIRLLGPLPQDAVAQLLHSADLFAAPCRVGGDGNADGLPTVLLEAMASGVPCISTRVTGIPEAIRHRETGILCPPDDLDALVRAIAEALAPDFDGARIAREARALIEREFVATRQAARLAALTRSAAPGAREVGSATTVSRAA